MYVKEHIAQTLRAICSCKFKGGKLIDVIDRSQSVFRLHEDPSGVKHFTAHTTQRIDKVCRDFQPIIGLWGFDRDKILPASHTDTFASCQTYTCITQNRRNRSASLRHLRAPSSS